MADDGSDKTQLVMFLDDGFAAANDGVPYSSVLLVWFTDYFFHGPAAGAAFATGGPFAIAEFTNLDTIGNSATAGSWMITGFQSLPSDDPNAQSGQVTAVIDEIAKIDKGPFDIELTLDDNGTFAIDKTVLNNTGADWAQFVMEIGTGLGNEFVPSANPGQLSFLEGFDNREETGAFPNVIVQSNRIVFTGALPAGGTANFIVFAQSDTNAEKLRS
jgi:hypothetical protein